MPIERVIKLVLLLAITGGVVGFSALLGREFDDMGTSDACIVELVELDIS